MPSSVSFGSPVPVKQRLALIMGFSFWLSDFSLHKQLKDLFGYKQTNWLRNSHFTNLTFSFPSIEIFNFLYSFCPALPRLALLGFYPVWFCLAMFGPFCNIWTSSPLFIRMSVYGYSVVHRKDVHLTRIVVTIVLVFLALNFPRMVLGMYEISR